MPQETKNVKEYMVDGMERGYVKLWRKTLESGLLTNPTAWQLFGYLLLKAAYKPTRTIAYGIVIDLEPGDVLFGYENAASELHSTTKSMRTALALLKKLEIVASRVTSKGQVISIINWNTYQQCNQEEGQADGQATGNHRASNGQATGKQRATIKEVKKERNEEILTPPLPPQGGAVPASCPSGAFWERQSLGGGEGTDGTEQEQMNTGTAQGQMNTGTETATERRRKSPSVVEYSQTFLAFWEAYPAKKGKDAAYKAWKQAHEKHPDVKAITIIEAIRHQVADHHFEGRDGQDYTPLPSTWLNQARWEDVTRYDEKRATMPLQSHGTENPNTDKGTAQNAPKTPYKSPKEIAKEREREQLFEKERENIRALLRDGIDPLQFLSKEHIAELFPNGIDAA